MMGNFITSIVAVLVFISGIALTTAGSIGALVENWNASVTGTLTVQVSGDPTSSATKANSIVSAIRGLSEIKRAEVVPKNRVQELLRPWVNDEKLLGDLPLPALIDIELNAPSAQNLQTVTSAIRAVAADAVVDDHRVWLNRIADFAHSLSYVALALMVMALGALVLTVVFATRASLTEYSGVIEVLHLVGARDRHIATQFSTRAMGQAVWGGVIGLLAFAPALGAVTFLVRRIDIGLLPSLTLPLPYLIGLCFLPLVAAAIAFFSAMATVRRALASMV